ncbi:MAG: zinc-binding dehydrogenase [Burkholderiales bacterium]
MPPMLALQKIAPAQGLALREVPEPTPPQGDEVLIDVGATGICGSDLHIDAWTPGYAAMSDAMPVTIGHEFSGMVAALGPLVKGVAKGDRVTLLPSVTCGACDKCLQGDYDACDTRTGIGVTRAGAFARWVKAPVRNCVPVPMNVSDELAALAEPLSVGARAVRTGEVRAGQTVLVLGPGTIGQSIALWARRAGAVVCIAGRDDAERLGVLRELGFEDLHDVGRRTLPEVLRARRFDVVFEATGVPQIVDQGLALLKRGGVFVCVGIHPSAAQVDLTRVVRRNLQIRGSYRAPRELWDEVMQMLAEEGASIAPMITHRLPLARVLEGFDLAHRRIASKVMVFPQ